MKKPIKHSACITIFCLFIFIQQLHKAVTTLVTVPIILGKTEMMEELAFPHGHSKLPVQEQQNILWAVQQITTEGRHREEGQGIPMGMGI